MQYDENYSIPHTEKAEARARAEEVKQAKKKAAKEKRKAEVRAQLESQKAKTNGMANTEKQYSAVPKPTKPQLKQKKIVTKGKKIFIVFNFNQAKINEIFAVLH